MAASADITPIKLPAKTEAQGLSDTASDREERRASPISAPPPGTILLTGSSGFVGAHLVPILRDRFPGARLVLDAFDVTDRAACGASVRAARPDAVIHLAGLASVPRAAREPDLAWRVNLGGTLALARASLAEVPDARFLFISSGDCYGASFAAGVPLDEAAALAPLNTYAATKAAADLALGAMAREGLRAVRLRPFNHTGPGQSDDYVVASFARQIASIAEGRAEPVLRVGDLSARRDFLDVRDVCAAYAEALVAPLPDGIALNIASGTSRVVGDVLAALASVAGVAVRIEVDPARLRPSDIPLACGDAGLARRLLGWAPRVPWETTLRDMIEDWRARIA